MADAVAKRPTRARKATSKVRVFDQSTRNEIRKKRLDALEADNWQEEKPKAEEEDDDEYIYASSGDGAHRPTRHARHADALPLLLFLTRSALCTLAEVAVDAPKRGRKKKKAKRDVWNATQKCKSLQVPPTLGASRVGRHGRPCRAPLQPAAACARQPDSPTRARARPQEVLDEAQLHKYPSWVPTYSSIAAAPSRYPPRRFCSVSGLHSKYKCPVTGEYLATMEAYTTHRETRLKGLV